jgi:hypothetical protein
MFYLQYWTQGIIVPGLCLKKKRRKLGKEQNMSWSTAFIYLIFFFYRISKVNKTLYFKSDKYEIKP